MSITINETGIEIGTLQDFLNGYETSLRRLYGANFYIKPEGVIDNLATVASTGSLTSAQQFQFLAQQFNPETATGQWQDFLYDRLGVVRLEAQRTIVRRTINGTAGTVVSADTLTFRNTTTDDRFILLNAATIGSGGTVEGTFRALEFGAISLPTDATLEVVAPVSGVTSVSFTAGQTEDTGRERETDAEYRVRFRQSKSLNAKSTRNAIISNLRTLVDTTRNLDVRSNRTNAIVDGINPHTVNVRVRHNTTDALFAAALFDTIADGVGMQGSTTVNVTDDAEQIVPVSWDNATEVSISINVEVTLNSGFTLGQVSDTLKQAMVTYANEDASRFSLGDDVYANEFYCPLYQQESISIVNTLQVKETVSGTFGDVVNLTDLQISTFDTANITITEAP